MAPPLSIIKIVKYCDVWGGGGALGGAKILQKIMAPPLSVIKIVKYCDVWREGGIGGGGRQNPTKNNGAPLSVIKIVKYYDVVGGGGALVALKSYKHNGAPSLLLRLLSIVASGEGGHWGR